MNARIRRHHEAPAGGTATVANTSDNDGVPRARRQPVSASGAAAAGGRSEPWGEAEDEEVEDDIRDEYCGGDRWKEFQGFRNYLMKQR